MATALEQDPVRFSTDGQTWQDGSDLAWDGSDTVTKIVVGSLKRSGTSGDGAKTVALRTPLPNDLDTRFKKLTHLHLWHLEIPSLPVLPKGLKCLDVRACVRLTVLPPLRDTLETLDIGECAALETLLASGAVAPAALRYYFFNDCGALKNRALHPFLVGLQSDGRGHGHLVELDGSRCPAVVDLDGVPRSVSKLVLAGCTNLRSVDGLAGFAALTHLNLSECTGLDTIELPPTLEAPQADGGHTSLARLQYLELRGASGLKTFHDAQGDQDIGPYDLESEGDPNVAHVFRTRRKFGATLEATARAKILLLGNGRAGKTTLSRLLRGLEPQKDQAFTQKVELDNWDTDFQLPAGRGQTINSRLGAARCQGDRLPGKAQIWDFGGQEIYHQTHRVFAAEGSVFVIVWTDRDTSANLDRSCPKYCPPDDWREMNQARSLDYWFDYITSLKTSGRPRIILVCQTTKATRGRRPDWRALAPRYASRFDRDDDEGRRVSLPCFFIESFEDDSRSSEDYHRLVAALQNACGAEAGRIGVLQPAPVVTLAHELSSKQRTGGEMILDRETWVRRLKETSGCAFDADDVRAITGVLHDSGVIFHVTHGGTSRVIVDQVQVADCVYEVMSPGGPIAKCVRERDQPGFVSDHELQLASHHWRALVTERSAETLLQFMQQCRILIALTDPGADGPGRLFLVTDKWLLPRREHVWPQIEVQMKHVEQLGAETTVLEFHGREIDDFAFRRLAADFAEALRAKWTEVTWHREGLAVFGGEPREKWMFWMNWTQSPDGFHGTLDAHLLAPRAHAAELVKDIERVVSGERGPFGREDVGLRRHDPGDEGHDDVWRKVRFARPSTTPDVGISSSGANRACAEGLQQTLRKTLPLNVLVRWYGVHGPRDADFKINEYLTTLNHTKVMVLVLSGAYLEFDPAQGPEHNIWCALELASAIVSVALGKADGRAVAAGGLVARPRAIEETILVCVGADPWKASGFAGGLQTLLQARADACRAHARLLAVRRGGRTEADVRFLWGEIFERAALEVHDLFGIDGHGFGGRLSIAAPPDGVAWDAAAIERIEHALRHK
jgi:hypothetical protein